MGLQLVMPQSYAKLQIQMDSIGEWMLETDESSSGPVSRFYRSIGGMQLMYATV